MPGTNDLFINTDGSAKTNPGANVGCAGIVTYPEYCDLKPEVISWSYDIGTSNSMEIFSIVNCLKWINNHAEELKNLSITRVIVSNDCENVVNGCRMAHIWRAKNWKKADGGDIRNKDDWRMFLTERQKINFPIEFIWQEGKKDEVRKDVDKEAKAAGEKPGEKRNFSHIKRLQGRSLSGKKFRLMAYEAKSQKALIRVYSHTAVNRSKTSEIEIRFEEIDENYEIVGRFWAYAHQIIAGIFHRGHYYNCVFGQSRHPVIESALELNKEESQYIKSRIII